VVGCLASDFGTVSLFRIDFRIEVGTIWGGMDNNDLHIVIACAASPTSAILPPALSHSPLLGGQSSSPIVFASVPAGISCTIPENGSVHPLANSFIQLNLFSLLSGTSISDSLPRNPARQGQLVRIWQTQSPSALPPVELAADDGTLRKENQKKAFVAGSDAWKKKGSSSRIFSHLVLEYGMLTPRSFMGRRLFS
jgi:hypothetical protein